MKWLIEAQEVVKDFGSQRAVDQVSLQVGPGEIYGLVGPDGAGKTTTIRLLCAALRLDSGSIHIGSYDMARSPEKGRALIGYLAQRFSMYEELTVEENLRFFAEVRGLAASLWRSRSQEILEFVGLYPYLNRRAGRLSGGMKQKLGLAAALVHSPQILLLDEPTTGVDPVTRQDFWQLIIRLAAEDKIAVFVSTPYMDEAARCHRLGFMRSGRMLVEGTPTDLRSRLAGQILEVTGRSLSTIRSWVLEEPSVLDAQMFGDRLHLRVKPDSAAQVIQHFSADKYSPEISAVRLIEPQLEDVFMALGDQQHA